MEGHLEQASESSESPVEPEEDVTDDNQLYEALNVLKGFQLLGRSL